MLSYLEKKKFRCRCRRHRQRPRGKNVMKNIFFFPKHNRLKPYIPFDLLVSSWRDTCYCSGSIFNYVFAFAFCACGQFYLVFRKDKKNLTLHVFTFLRIEYRVVYLVGFLYAAAANEFFISLFFWSPRLAFICTS